MNEFQRNTLKNAKKRLLSRGMQKSLAALEHKNKPNTEPPPRPAEFHAVTELGHRGMHNVEKGDGTAIQFKNAEYWTNDPVEARLLENTPGVSVSRHKNAGRGRKVYAVPALPWHKDDDE